MSTSRRVLIVDDHALLSDTVCMVLESRGHQVAVCHPTSFEAVTAHAAAFEPDVVLLDLELGLEVGDGVALIRPLRATGADIVILSATTSRHVLAECAEAGAVTFLAKGSSVTELVEAVSATRSCLPPVPPLERTQLIAELQTQRRRQTEARRRLEQLRPRERQVLALVMSGQTVQEIAREWTVSQATVRNHVQRMIKTLGVGSQVQAVALALDAGWGLNRSHTLPRMAPLPA